MYQVMAISTEQIFLYSALGKCQGPSWLSVAVYKIPLVALRKIHTETPMCPFSSLAALFNLKCTHHKSSDSVLRRQHLIIHWQFIF